MKAVTEALEKMTPIEKATRKLNLAGVGGPMNGCGVGARPCKGIATAQVGCCCDTLHYGVNACEKHIGTAVKAVYANGCEVEVHRIYTAGVDQKLFVGRRNESAKLSKYQKFVEDMHRNYGAARHPDRMMPAPSDDSRGELVGEYTAAKQVVQDIERFRNSLNQS